MLHIPSDADFLEYLPVPCLYLDEQYFIVRANRKARSLIASPYAQSIDGLSIFNTDFAKTYLKTEASLTDRLHELSSVPNQVELDISEQLHGLDISLRNNVKRDNRKLPSRPNCGTEWRVSQCLISGSIYFAVTGQEIISSWKETKLSAEEEYEMFLQISEPARDVPYYVNIISADLQNIQVNDRGRTLHSTLARSFEDRGPLNLFNETFTAPFDFSGAPGPTALTEGCSGISIKRGFENPNTGQRGILDTTCTILNSPFTDKPMGVLVQARDAQDWAEYLQRIDIYTRTNELEEGKKPVMVRSMLNNGKLDYFSDSWEKFSKHTRQHLLESWTDWIHPEDLPKVDKMIKSSLASGKACEYQVRYRKNESAYHYFEERFAPLRDEVGRLIRWYSVSTDIHDLVLARKKAQRTSDNLYRIVNNMSVLLFEIDDTWKVISAEGSLKISSTIGQQWTADQYIGQDVTQLVQSMNPKGVQELVDSLLDILGGRSQKAVVDYNFGDQHLRTIVISNSEEGEADIGVTQSRKKLYGLTMDVSAERKHEIAKMQLETMKETENLKAEFLANVSHELRTPIAGLVGILELLSDTSLDSIQSEYLRVLETSAQSLLVIVNDILDLSRAEATEPTIVHIPFDYTMALEEVCKSNEALLTKKGLDFVRKPLAFSKKLLGDPGRVKQILQNLIGNAIKFTSSGSITIDTSYELLQNSVKLVTTIADTGIGIDPTTLSFLFKPFVQADQSTTRIYGGSGLGLSIARKFAQKMGGDVQLESVKGVGTRAIFSLELIFAEVETSPLGDLLAGGRLSRSSTTLSLDKHQNKVDCHILVVEDNKINQKVVMSHLRKLGYLNTICVENGLEAVEFVKRASRIVHEESESNPHQEQHKQTQARPRLPDLIFMDCQMPVLDGYDATRQLRLECGYHRPIIALTASAIKGDKERCFAAGMDDHVAKPVSQKVLNETLEKWLTGALIQSTEEVSS